MKLNFLLISLSWKKKEHVHCTDSLMLHSIRFRRKKCSQVPGKFFVSYEVLSFSSIFLGQRENWESMMRKYFNNILLYWWFQYCIFPELVSKHWEKKSAITWVLPFAWIWSILSNTSCKWNLHFLFLNMLSVIPKHEVYWPQI